MKKKRFFKSVWLTLLLLFIISIFVALYTKNNKISYTSYVVQSGDTLSSISHSIEPDKDWRILSDKIRYYNNIGPEIYPGQVIKVPITGE